MDLKTEEYLRNARKNKIPVKEMAKHLGKGERTVQRYLGELGLSGPTTLAIDANTVLGMYNGGMTGSEIAQALGISHAAVTNRLSKFGIKLDRAEGIRRHFAKTYEARWPEAKSLLDDGMSFTNTALAVNMRPEHLRNLMCMHGYVKSNDFDLDKIREVFDKIINDPTVNAKRRDSARTYLAGMLSYVDKFRSLPRATQLAKHMDLPIQTVSWWFKHAGLADLLNTAKTSYLVSALLRLLERLDIKYELNRRDIIAPYEIDVWLYEHGTGIEVNPVTTHSPDMPWGKDDIYYHQKKSLAALSKGIGFAHFYDMDLMDVARWDSFCGWLCDVVSGKAWSGDCVNLDRFLRGAPVAGAVSEPGCFLVNPNTIECRICDGIVREDDVYFRKVYTAGFLNLNSSVDS